MKPLLLECDCQDLGHILKFTKTKSYFESSSELIIESIVDTNIGFFRRLKYGLRFIFGLEVLSLCESIINVKKVNKLNKFLTKFLKKTEIL